MYTDPRPIEFLSADVGMTFIPPNPDRIPDIWAIPLEDQRMLARAKNEDRRAEDEACSARHHPVSSIVGQCPCGLVTHDS